MGQDSFDLDRIGGRRAFDGLVDAVLSAGETALTLYRQGAGSRARTKPDQSPVTEADQQVENLLRAHVERHFPDAGFFGEETGGSGQGGLRFVVDPIDGTRAFMRGLPTWSILVGLEMDGEPVLGVAYMPAAGDLFTAVRGQGAYGNGRPLQVSAVDRLDQALVCHGGLAQFTEDGRDALLLGLARHTFTQRGLADFASYAALLRGQADAVVDPGVAPYDVAPAAVLVREAGGRFTALDGQETIHGPGALASNGPLHPALLELARGRGAFA